MNTQLIKREIKKPNGEVYAEVWREGGQLRLVLSQYSPGIQIRMDEKAIPQLIEALKSIADPERQEPFGFVALNEVTEQFNSVNCGTIYRLPAEGRLPLYTHSQLKQEQGEPDYKALWQQICERCDELDAKLVKQDQDYPFGVYGAEDLDRAWKSGYDNCKAQSLWTLEDVKKAWKSGYDAAKQEQGEPVGQVSNYDTKTGFLYKDLEHGTLLYTTSQQPVIDKSSAIRIATALGWTPPNQERDESEMWATKEDFYRELDLAVNHALQQVEVKSVTMRCASGDIALPIIESRNGRILVEQVIAPQNRTWVGMTEEDFVCVHQLCDTPIQAAEYVDHLLKEKNSA